MPVTDPQAPATKEDINRLEKQADVFGRDMKDMKMDLNGLIEMIGRYFVATDDKFKELRHEMSDGFADVRREMSDGFAEVEQKFISVRQAMSDGFAVLKMEMDEGFAKTKEEMSELRLYFDFNVERLRNDYLDANRMDIIMLKEDMAKVKQKVGIR